MLIEILTTVELNIHFLVSLILTFDRLFSIQMNLNAVPTYAYASTSIEIYNVTRGTLVVSMKLPDSGVEVNNEEDSDDIKKARNEISGFLF